MVFRPLLDLWTWWRWDVSQTTGKARRRNEWRLTFPQAMLNLIKLGSLTDTLA